MESRRGLIKKSLAGAVLLAAAGAVPLALRKTRLRAPRAKLQFFTPAEYSIWAAVADRVLDTDSSAIDVAGKADAFLAPLPSADAKDLKQLLALFDNALFNLSARPFTQKSAAEQDAQLAGWETSRLAVKRTGFQAMKRLSCALYYSDPRTYASIGYPGPPVELVRSVENR